MSEVAEIPPDFCPSCGAHWRKPGAMLPGWDAMLGLGHRTWWCTACDTIHHPEHVEIRER